MATKWQRGPHIRGSSPRLRGTPITQAVIDKEQRFIPAPAGNTATGTASATAGTVHPRACGEHLIRRRLAPVGVAVHPRACGEHCCVATADSAANGSSPRLRGTQTPRALRVYNTSVHPRACGEHQTLALLLRLEFRFIPAPAGNTDAVREDRAKQSGSSPRLRGTLGPPRAGVDSRSVHPRACGEHLSERASCKPSGGSSPRLRGTPHDAMSA